jgi:hypothetical protein
LAYIFIFKDEDKGNVVWVSEEMSFFVGVCGGVDGNGAAIEAGSIFPTALDAHFFLTDFGASSFYCGKVDFRGYGMCFPLDALHRGPSSVRDMIRFAQPSYCYHSLSHWKIWPCNNGRNGNNGTDSKWLFAYSGQY